MLAARPYIDGAAGNFRDESVKPQTANILISAVLGIQHGIVALTKSDLVDQETLDLVRLELDDFLRNSFLQGAPIVPVSAKTARAWSN